MYNIAICDDDTTFRNVISNIIIDYITNHTVCAKIKQYSNGAFLIDDIEDGFFYDMYILDIEMPGILGTDIAKVVRKYSSDVIIIFVTSYLQYTLESFELGIFRYIPKENINEGLLLALRAGFLKLDCQEGKFYLMSNAKRSNKIFLKEILYIYKDEKNSIFVLSNQDIKAREPLFEVYRKLPPEDFIQIDRCYIVNIRYIYTIDSVKRLVYLNDGTKLDVSRNRIQEVKQRLNKFWGAKI